MSQKIKLDAKEQVKARYNALIEKYYTLRRQADIVKDEIDRIEGLVEYET